MTAEPKEFISQIPQLDMTEGTEMLNDFSREAQRHLISARNSLLILETVPSDKESIENAFRTFHTIKGLADFLKLNDIFVLTGKAEYMMNMVRKDLLAMNPEILALIKDVLKTLQRLLELLDEQIANDGKLESPYPDIVDLISQLQLIIDKKGDASLLVRTVAKAIPTIHFEPDMFVFQRIEDQVKSSADEVKVDKELLKKLLSDFQETGRELKDIQGKLLERQRELIKERELAIKLTQQAQAEARGKSEYLANMSHEIRTLINAILGFTNILKDSALTDKQKDHLQTITVSGKMLLEIVNDILDFSKVEAGKLKLEHIEFNLGHITDEVFKIIRSRLNNKPINLYFHIQDDVPHYLVGDPTRVKQIFMNLLDNAIKFTESGEIGMTIAPAPIKDKAEGVVGLSFVVKDTGIGIPGNRINALFQTFTQANESTTRIYGGTGLGLSLCKTFVEKMGGHIEVHSELGKGTTFQFFIPFGRSNKQDQTDANLRKLLPGSLQMLIVSAHDKTIASFQSSAKPLGLKDLYIATSVKQASEMLIELEGKSQSLPQVIYIDTMLPDKEAYMLAYKIRQQERYHAIHLLAVTSDARIEISSDYQQAGFETSLLKPVIRQELVDSLTRVLNKTPNDHRVMDPKLIDQISCEGIRVLVVEDSLPNQELLKIHLESLGCVFEYASNGQEAIDLLRKNKYDVCLMDLQMPIMGGLEATKFIRTELKSAVPIIALTAAEIQEEREKCVTAGMNHYLAKPFGLEDLKEVIIKSTKM